MELKQRMDALQKEYLRERQDLSTKLLQAIRSHEVCTEPVNFYPPSSAGLPESADPLLSQFRYPPPGGVLQQQQPQPIVTTTAAPPTAENPSSATTTVQNLNPPIPTTLPAPSSGGNGNTSS